ncbi:MAG: hypothetical protein KR126chlam2_01341 [Chlamydiae bacterium]|nr:hypothetical protein [Chlamydiota bacterium]
MLIMRNFFAIAITLFLVIDALGILPTYVSMVDKLNKKRRTLIAVRELFIALGIMIIFHYFGHVLLNLLEVTKTTVQISGGIVLFLIAVRLIFATEQESNGFWGKGEPFIVPIATPLIAGPSLLALIMIYAQEQPHNPIVLGAIFLAWFVSAIIILCARPIYRLMGEKGLMACQSLMGLIVGLIAVEMFLRGVKGLIL